MSTESLEKWKLKNPEKVKQKNKEYYEKNREICLKKNRDFYLKNFERIKKIKNARFHSLPHWEKILKGIQGRCHVKSNTAYRWYGAKGIKCFLTKEQIKDLWFRDNADKLENPSIDRIDSSGHYEFNNCRFIDRWENSLRSSFGKRGWSRKYTNCILCGKNDTKHNSFGRCSRCYNRIWTLKRHKRDEKNAS
ncbi:hypothetical protein KW791_00640 [Candidatus Parcubacteria bacterium]|nr:hypothetical protein [Candidatus Parcubacteria bacterium]